MPPIPLITGIGLATPLGKTRQATWDSLCAGGAILNHARVPNLPMDDEPRVNLLARRVAREAITDAKWGEEETRSAALIVATSKGPVDSWLDRPSRITNINDAAFGLAETATAVAMELRNVGPRLTLCGACASGLLGLIRGAMMIRAGEASRVIVVAAESSLHPLFIGSFQRLGVIPPEGWGCRPFDRSRAGFVIGEAAAAICLEAGDGSQSGRHAVAVERFAMGADAAHLTSGDPSGATLRRLLRRVTANLPIDLVHAHGTGTSANDPLELAIIDETLHRVDETRPSLYSHKGAIGHSLGAAGLVAVALNALSHRDGVVLPNVHTLDPLSAEVVEISRLLRRRPIRRSVAMAAGFGGAVAAVTLVTAPAIAIIPPFAESAGAR